MKRLICVLLVVVLLAAGCAPAEKQDVLLNGVFEGKSVTFEVPLDWNIKHVNDTSSFLYPPEYPDNNPNNIYIITTMGMVDVDDITIESVQAEMANSGGIYETAQVLIVDRVTSIEGLEVAVVDIAVEMEGQQTPVKQYHCFDGTYYTFITYSGYYEEEVDIAALIMDTLKPIA